MVSYRLPSFNGKGFARSLVLTRTKREIGGFLDAIGPDNLRIAIETNTSFAEALKEKESFLKEKLQQYQWTGGILTEEVILGIIPDWVRAMVADYGEPGQEWLKIQVAWFRQMLGGKDA